MSMADGETRSAYGVKLVRGPFLRLDPHPDHCETVDQALDLIRSIRVEKPDSLFAADLLSGARGLSLGLQDAGFKVVVGVDHYAEAVETHRHHFPGLTVDFSMICHAECRRKAHRWWTCWDSSQTPWAWK
jgi:DNA (cytosine-5)-methyltransferase 1